MEATVDPLPRGPDWMPITPKTGSFFHADSQRGEKSVAAEAFQLWKLTVSYRAK